MKKKVSLFAFFLSNNKYYLIIKYAEARRQADRERERKKEIHSYAWKEKYVCNNKDKDVFFSSYLSMFALSTKMRLYREIHIL